MATATDLHLSPTPDACSALPGFRFLESLGCDRLGEVWTVLTPQKQLRAVKFLYGFVRHQIPESAARLADFRHPGLLTVEQVADDRGRLVLVTELADMTLRGRFEMERSQGALGIPRAELLPYLRSAAEALDYLTRECDTRHLGLSPRNLVLRKRQLLVADFGLVELLGAPPRHTLAELNPRYAAPELCDNRPHRHSDQYSLALIYHEMLTGVSALKNRFSSRVPGHRLLPEPNLDYLPAADRRAIARALSPDPNGRFPSCVEMVWALEAEEYGPSQDHASGSRLVPWPPPQAEAAIPVEDVVQRMVLTAAQRSVIREVQGLRFRIDDQGVLWHSCGAWLPAEVGWRKLEAFLSRWKAEEIQVEGQSVLFQLHFQSDRRKRLFSWGAPVFEVKVQFGKVVNRRTEVAVTIRPLGKRGDQSRQSLEELAPLLLTDLHTYLLAEPERRIQERFDFRYQLRVAPSQHPQHDQALECWGKDISPTGIGLYLPEKPAGSPVYIYQVADTEDACLPIPAAVTRVRPTEDGWYEVGARFLLGDRP